MRLSTIVPFKFLSIVLSTYALSDPAAKLYSINNFGTENPQLDQAVVVDFDVGPTDSGEANTHCRGSVPYNQIDPSDATVSGQNYRCDDSSFSFLYEEGSDETGQNSVYLYQEVPGSKTLTGTLSFPTPDCEITPFMYICDATQNYTIAME